MCVCENNVLVLVVSFSCVVVPKMHAEQESNEKSTKRAPTANQTKMRAQNQCSAIFLASLVAFLDVVSCCGVALWNLSATWLEINPNRNVVGFRLIKKANWLLVGRICFRAKGFSLRLGRFYDCWPH